MWEVWESICDGCCARVKCFYAVDLTLGLFPRREVMVACWASGSMSAQLPKLARYYRLPGFYTDADASTLSHIMKTIHEAERKKLVDRKAKTSIHQIFSDSIDERV